MPTQTIQTKRDLIFILILGSLSALLYLLPNGFEERVDTRGLRCRGRIVAVDNTDILQHGMVKTGDQGVSVEILDGRFAGRRLQANNPLLGQMDRDKIFEVDDVALVILTLDNQGKIVYVNPQAHYRIGLELLLFGLFVLALICFGGWTGIKALLSFVFAGLMLWKVLVPALLKGDDPLALTFGVVAGLTGVIIFLVAGFNRKGLTAFCGALLGVLTSCVLAVYFTDALHVHGAVMPFAETLLYAGYGHLNLTAIYSAAVFLAASGAVMDIAMDVAASMDELAANRPDISRRSLFASGIRVGRAVVGTMTTTLLLAYSGGYVTLLMAFMAQGVPLTNLFNLVYVAAEILKTLVGSFGLVMVAPFTALVGGFFLVKPKRKTDQKAQSECPLRGQVFNLDKQGTGPGLNST